MVIGFKKQFIQKIKSGKKIHTIRRDEHNRWKPGMTMHMATGIRTKKYRCFDKKVCKSIQDIRIIHFDTHMGSSVLSWASVWIDGKPLKDAQVKALALNDGFMSIKEFFEWFNTDFTGRLIHWTNKKY